MQVKIGISSTDCSRHMDFDIIFKKSNQRLRSRSSAAKHLHLKIENQNSGSVMPLGLIRSVRTTRNFRVSITQKIISGNG